MSLNQIPVFVSVVKEGSFTAAARRLRLPKSTVSRRVSDLEARLGVRLLHRTTRRLGLTDEGAAFYRRCSVLVEELEEAEREVAEAGVHPRGLLRLTAPVDLGIRFFGPILSEFLMEHPDVRAEMELTGRRVDLVEEGFDLAIRVGPLEESTLVVRKLGDTRRRICAAPEYLTRAGTPDSLDDLVHHQAVAFGSTVDGARLRLTSEGSPVEVPVEARLAVNHFEQVRNAALVGLGIAVLPAFLCADDIATGRLVSILEEHVPEQGALYAVYPGHRQRAPKVKAFLDFLQERLAGTPWLAD